MYPPCKQCKQLNNDPPGAVSLSSSVTISFNSGAHSAILGPFIAQGESLNLTLQS